MRQRIVNEFDIAEYMLTAKEKFAEFPKLNCVVVQPINEYVLSPQIKAALKKNADFTCDFCRRQFKPNELEIHHRNHNRGDNRRDNLLVLCTSCHNLVHAAEGGTFTQQRLRNIPAAELKLLYETASANGNTSDAQKFYRQAIAAYQKLAATDLDALYELANLSKLPDAKALFAEYLLRAKQLKTLDFRQSVRVAFLYAKGLCTSKNLSEARKYFESARKIGKPENFIDREYIELCNLLGTIDEASRLHNQAIELLESAVLCRPNDWAACYELGKLYGDKTLMRELFTQAAKMTDV